MCLIGDDEGRRAGRRDARQSHGHPLVGRRRWLEVAPARVQEHEHVAEGVAHDQVRTAVVVEVGDRQPVGVRPDVVCRLLDKPARAVAEPDGQPGGAEDREVGVAVAVEVGGADGQGRAGRRQRHRVGEPTAPQAVEHAERLAPGVQRHKGRRTVGDQRGEDDGAGPVATLDRRRGRDHRREARPRAVEHRRLEGERPLVPKDFRLAARLVRQKQIGEAVLVHVADRDVGDVRADRDHDGGPETAFAIAREDRQRAVAEVPHDEVGRAVAVEVGGDDLRRLPSCRQRAHADEPAVPAGEQ